MRPSHYYSLLIEFMKPFYVNISVRLTHKKVKFSKFFRRNSIKKSDDFTAETKSITQKKKPGANGICRILSLHFCIWIVIIRRRIGCCEQFRVRCFRFLLNNAERAKHVYGSEWNQQVFDFCFMIISKFTY